MTTQEIRIAIAEARGRVFSKSTNSQGIRILPCPSCGNKDVRLFDCGYSSFNPGWAKCKCGYEFKSGYVDSWKDVVTPWNRHCRNNTPDYPNDLNAIIPILPSGTVILRDGEQRWFVKNLDGSIQENGTDLAKVACKFLLRTIGKWKEEA